MYDLLKGAWYKKRGQLLILEVSVTKRRDEWTDWHVPAEINVPWLLSLLLNIHSMKSQLLDIIWKLRRKKHFRSLCLILSTYIGANSPTWVSSKITLNQLAYHLFYFKYEDQEKWPDLWMGFGMFSCCFLP